MSLLHDENNIRLCFAACPHAHCSILLTTTNNMWQQNIFQSYYATGSNFLVLLRMLYVSDYVVKLDTTAMLYNYILIADK